ncbi:hypothetical protein VUR80DRAFT_9460 [Thermomyces stellatus]
MLSHLRFHRRGSSNPTSPIADQQSPRDGGPGSPDARPSSSNSSSLPPTLPPIARVTSSSTSFGLGDFSSATMPHKELPPDPPRGHAQQRSDRQQPTTRAAPMKSPYHQDTGFIGGVALQKYREEAARRQEQADTSGPDAQHPAGVPPATLSTSTSMPTLNKPSTSFVTPTDLRSGVSPTGRIPPPNASSAAEPYSNAAGLPVEPSRGKRGLPFLKNPMSTLLMRRKASQNAPDILPLPLQNNAEPEFVFRGTKVHDFNAPRPRRPATQVSPGGDAPNVPKQPYPYAPPIPDKSSLRRHPGESVEPPGQPGPRPSSSTDSTGTGTPSTRWNAVSSVSSNTSLQHSIDKPLPPRASPPIVPPKDNVSVPSSRFSSSTTARSSTRSGPGTNANPSVKSVKSARSGSLARDILSRDSLSSLPKHMKSTSSRFSFDMIGAAKQEKLLEERHRQRQLEMGIDPDLGGDQRDSRFDDMDDFDYDAMMDDDGLEEPIPGVNADYDEEPIPGMKNDYEEAIPGVNVDHEDKFDGLAGDNPNNDQKDFSGLVFERSPKSGLPTPHSAGLMATPRDEEGNRIGLTCSKDSPLGEGLSPQPLPTSPRGDATDTSDGVSALAIQNLTVSDEKKPDHETRAPQTIGGNGQNDDDDDLYFDDGMIGMDADEFADELDFSADKGEPFNEALFDLDDTDEYGRPIPGAFQAAKKAYAARHADQSKRESDGTSGQFDQSVMSPSTTRTSVSAPGPQHPVSKVPSEEVSPEHHQATFGQAVPASEDDPMAAYQRALAAATHKAAADGKFRRDSPPQSPGPPTTEVHPPDPDPYDEPTTFDFDDYERVDFDLDDLDDDDIIAEANASALANDSEGWYGTEFGFYSAPAGQLDLPFEYANGGYFGPSGPNAGRAVSREPNLTPITERSEYSNRNSIMSLAVPPIGSASSMQSPGLAQLAMMADGDDNMTLSALLRLRTKAWGGSQASLASSRDGSPRSERGEGSSSPQQLNVRHARKNSGFSVLSEAHSLPASPTVAMDASGAPAAHASQSANASPVEERNPRGHRHKGSAGSISYMQEESGEGWVVERRRMDESGEVEVEREVLPAERI